MTTRPRFDPDAPYLTHARSAALYYRPLPSATLAALHIVRDLMAYTTDPAELAWLEARADFLIATCPECPPCAVRNVDAPRRDRPPRHETKYALRSYGPTNKSGKARS